MGEEEIRPTLATRIDAKELELQRLLVPEGSA